MDEDYDAQDSFTMKMVERFEHFITLVLLLFMMLAILVATIDMGRQVFAAIFSDPFLLVDVMEVSTIFGLVFMVLISLELLENIKTYLSKEQLHVEVVLLVAMIAIARKVILLDVKYMEAPVLYGIAAIILALAAGFFFLRLAYQNGADVRNPGDAAE